MIVDIEPKVLGLQRNDTITDSIELVQRLKACPEPHFKTIQAVERWRQVRLRMRCLLRGIKRCEICRMDGKNPINHATCRASILHKDFWLEALDEQHRYGFHLRAFHKAWKHEMTERMDRLSSSRDSSFFHWLDYGNGKNVHVPECSQQDLRSTCVEYCNAEQRKRYEVKFVSYDMNDEVRVEYALSGHVVHTDEQSKWIFVLDLSGQMYLGRKRKGRFHHSSFVTGGPIFAAGKIIIKHGVIIAIEPHSGHFKPRLANLLALCFMLAKHGIDIENIAFIKPKKWTCAWPFPSQPGLELEDFVGTSDTDYGADKSDSEESQSLMVSVE
ncbi:unnamed protein product [Peronospora belbahrii]|uniref:Uncharacterized protein n=1 Tax=Peronospora belbahrii TaxID=622444 RepID=A0AAU9L046_9STRA|nr:unnamed protein product [Peronospora belbahrii]